MSPSREQRDMSALSKYKKDFDGIFLDTIPDYMRTLYEPAKYHFKAGGKRWRPFMIRQVARAFGMPKKYSLPLEVSVEYIHNWSLVHDDIEDGDTERRNKPTVWKKYGVDHAVNVGDVMQGLTLELLSNGVKHWGDKKTLHLYKFLGETIRKLCEGQNMEFDFRNKKSNITEEEYLKMAELKTAALVRFGIVGIADTIGVEKKVRDGLNNYSKLLPLAFQIQDDVLNIIAGDEYGKEIGGDIKEGKRTIPLIHCINRANKKEKKQILEIILKPRDETTKEDVDFVSEKMKGYSSIDYSIEYSRILARNAAKTIKVLPECEEKDAMEEIALWLGVERTF